MLKIITIIFITSFVIFWLFGDLLFDKKKK